MNWRIRDAFYDGLGMVGGVLMITGWSILSLAPVFLLGWVIWHFAAKYW